MVLALTDRRVVLDPIGDLAWRHRPPIGILAWRHRPPKRTAGREGRSVDMQHAAVGWCNTIGPTRFLMSGGLWQSAVVDRLAEGVFHLPPSR